MELGANVMEVAEAGAGQGRGQLSVDRRPLFVDGRRGNGLEEHRHLDGGGWQVCNNWAMVFQFRLDLIVDYLRVLQASN